MGGTHKLVMTCGYDKSGHISKMKTGAYIDRPGHKQYISAILFSMTLPEFYITQLALTHGQRHPFL